MTVVPVNLPGRAYDVVISAGRLEALGHLVRDRASSSRAIVITDEHVAAHAHVVAATLSRSGLETAAIVVPSGEGQKSLAAAADLYDRLAVLRCDRRTLVVAVGGGVIGDLAGFVAATYSRGLPWLVVPTSLLAMVDSAVGGKVAINHAKGKNLIGAFHQPVGVWVDTDFLNTLPEREYRSGLAEVVKYGVILDAELFGYLEANSAAILARTTAPLGHVIARCCRLKADIVERDERDETGLRAILNYGHTFAHAFETLAGYDGRLMHGEAVAAGMVCAARLAEGRGLISSETYGRQQRLLERFGLPTQAPLAAANAAALAGRLLEIMLGDKKAVAGRLRLVLPRRLGEAGVVDDVPESDVLCVLAQMLNPTKAG